MQLSQAWSFAVIAAPLFTNIDCNMKSNNGSFFEHEVVTDDGYYLTMQRIPHVVREDNPPLLSSAPKPAVLLQHGLALEGSNWVTNLPNSSLGFILADASYDVWIGNNRGNSWSRKHKKFEFHHQEYSAYSFHEMAMYDLPAMINYILQKTGQEQLYYVAYSQGTTTGFIAFSSIPELDRKIKMFFALAPITTNSNMKSPIVRVFDLPEGMIKLVQMQAPILFIMGFLSMQRINVSNGFLQSRIDVYLSHYPDSTSIKNMLHWRQIYQTGEFKYYDYGSDNMLHYNQTTPPFYELENMKAPLAAWYGGRDWLSVPEDVNITLSRITNVVHKKYIPKFVHFDFLWSMQAYEQVYKEILELMEKNA
uniref:AB hydrolase-1 domain-containing protein n=1 Tax=Strix occidentalis caurina TaxID=311401 RepID=A0A8D0FM59_STROC